MRSFIGIAVCALVFTWSAVAEEWTYTEGDSWVRRYIDRGGDMRNVTGLVMPDNWQENAVFDDIEPARNLPEMFDWRWKVAGLQPIKNQRNCGSCWAFSVVATLEALIKIQTGKVVDLSEQTLVSSCSSSGSCSGGYYSAFDYMRSPGLPGESQDPYKAYNTSCKQGLSPEEDIIQWRYVGSRDRAPTTAQIKTALMQKGPLSVTVHASSSMKSYGQGIFNNCYAGSINHMVNIEGWNDDGQYWVMRNSWGDDWGEWGYMRIRYNSSSGSKCNQIGAQAAYAVYKDGILPN